MDEMVAWHFLPKDGRLNKPLPDRSRPIVTPGWSFHADNPFTMRQIRLHGWSRAIDALSFARGFVICRVRLHGTILSEPMHVHSYPYPDYPTKAYYGNDFTVLWTGDARRVIYRLVCDLAEEALHILQDGGWVPDSRLWEMITAKQEWIETARVHGDLSPRTPDSVRETIRIPLNPRLVRSCWMVVDAASLEWSFESRSGNGMVYLIQHMMREAAAAFSSQRINAELERRLTEAFGGTEADDSWN